MATKKSDVLAAAVGRYSPISERDDENPVYMLQGVSDAVLAGVVRGEIDLLALARLELANRGLNRQAKWVGFAEAFRLAQQLPVRDGRGGVTFVSVPE